MKKILIAIIAIGLGSSALAATITNSSVLVGYQSKLVEYGEVTSTGVYNANVDLNWESFNLGVITYNSLQISPFEAALHRVDLVGGYKFTSTLTDVTVGTSYVHFNTTNKFDYSGHWRPFVRASGKFYVVTATYDTESRLSNLEAKLKTDYYLARRLKLVPSIFAGYTDVADALPRTVKAINYDNAYYGGALDMVYAESIGVGTYVVRNNHLNSNQGGWHAFASLKF